jgi:hypothetical protein
MIERILYQSTATQDFGSLALSKLFTAAQIRNAQLEITGHLLFHNGQFTQRLVRLSISCQRKIQRM